MIIGDKSQFAIESGITQAYERLSFRALGFFVIHIAAHTYGVQNPDATLLACSFDEVQRRIARRGTHHASCAIEPDPAMIAEAFHAAIYAPDQQARCFFGIPQLEVRSLIYENNLSWSPDGDEAFDDGSHVIHFDIEDRVRLIGYKVKQATDHRRLILNSVSDVWLAADSFYSILKRWRDAFEAEWMALPKIPTSKDGAERT